MAMARAVKARTPTARTTENPTKTQAPSVAGTDQSNQARTTTNAARDTQNTPVDSRKARALFQQWVKSSSHAKALRRIDYAFVSTGVIQRGDSIWAVQIFWSPPRLKGIFQ